MPQAVVTTGGHVLYTKADMQLGRELWRSIGGQQLGSIWGHGALAAPDWSADRLHREANPMLEQLARNAGESSFASLDAEQHAALKTRILPGLRRNTYDATHGAIAVSNIRAQAMATVVAHYERLFGNDPATAELRNAYAMRNNTIAESDHRRAITAFFRWTAQGFANRRAPAPLTGAAAPLPPPIPNEIRMLEFYPQIKWVHIACVLASGALFALRGLLVQAGHAGAAQWTPVRWLSYAIDTTLLTAALMLLTILPHALFANGWLTVKLILLVVYVVLGSYALKRARTPRGRLGCYLGALLVYITVLGIARMHNPLGWLYLWMA